MYLFQGAVAVLRKRSDEGKRQMIFSTVLKFAAYYSHLSDTVNAAYSENYALNEKSRGNTSTTQDLVQPAASKLSDGLVGVLFSEAL